MANWDDSPPTQQELNNESSWDQTPPDDQSSVLGAAVKGGLNGLALNWLPNIEGGAQAALDLLKGNTDVVNNYRKNRDEAYQDIENTKNAHPIAYNAGNITGGVGAFAIPGLGELNVGKAALLGAAAGLGGSRADLTTGNPEAIGEAAKDAGYGALAGAAGQKAGEVLGGALGKLAGNRTAAAEAGAGDVVNANPYSGIGKTVLDQNVLQKNDLLGTLGKAQDAVENLKNDRDLYISSLGDKLSKLNPHDVSQQVGTAADKGMNLLQDLTNDAGNYSSDTGNSVISDIASPMQDYINKLHEAGNNIEELNDIKSSIQSEVDKLTKGGAYNKFNPNPGMMNQADALKQLGGVVKDHIEQLADFVDKGAGEILANKNQQIGNLSQAIKGINSKISSGYEEPSLAGTAINVGKAMVSPGAYTGATAAKSIAKNFSLSPQTNQNIASYAEKAANMAKQYGSSVARTGSLYTASNDELKDLATRLQQENGTQHIGQALNNAIDSGDPAAKNRAIFLIKQTSGARDIADKANQENNEQ